MDNNILVSIVVPVFNVEKYISECIKSIISQTYSNLEIILVDDGSEDNSGKICEDFSVKDTRIKYIKINNSGVSTARNKGIELATGKYISFIDSDDIIDKQYIEILLKNTEGNILPVCNMKEFKNTVEYGETKNYSLYEINSENFIELYKIHLMNTPCCKLFSLNIIKNNKIRFDENYSLGEDLLFNLKYLKYIDKIRIIKIKIYYYRKESNNTLTNRYMNNYKDIYVYLFDRFKESFINYNNQIELYKCLYRLLYLAIEYEFMNRTVSIFKRIKNARNVLTDEEVNKRMTECYKHTKTTESFLLSKKLIIVFKVLCKFGIINKA